MTPTAEQAAEEPQGGDALDDEFDTLADWTRQAVDQLGSDYALSAGCKGSGQPSALDWLLAHLQLGAADVLLDSGAGVGGPAAYAAEKTGARPVLFERTAGACRAARHLFGLPVVTADVHALPIQTGRFDVAWSLGVLCTSHDKTQFAAELRRVLSPGGRLGLLVYERTRSELLYQPEGNDFSTPAETDRLLVTAGFETTATELLAQLPEAPEGWSAAADAVDARIAEQHATDPRWQRAEQQSSMLGRLIEGGHISGRLITARAD